MDIAKGNDSIILLQNILKSKNKRKKNTKKTRTKNNFAAFIANVLLGAPFPLSIAQSDKGC